MDITQAKRLAESLADEMSPCCERVEVAGSIRRGKRDVKDIELVAIPKWVERQDLAALFAQNVQVNLLHQEWAISNGNRVHWIKPGVSDIIPWHVKPDGKYWRGLLSEGIKLDLFLTTKANWGIIYLIRTGPAEFSEAVVTHAKAIGKRCINGGLQTSDGEPIRTLEEQDVFDVLNLAYVPPLLRIGRDSLRAKR